MFFVRENPYRGRSRAAPQHKDAEETPGMVLPRSVHRGRPSHVPAGAEKGRPGVFPFVVAGETMVECGAEARDMRERLGACFPELNAQEVERLASATRLSS